VSWVRFAWVGPLTVVAVFAVNYAIKLLIQVIDPSLAGMSQLQRPLISISVEGATAAVLVFAVVGLLVPRPLFWYRILAIAALIVSFVPDIGLGMGGQARLAVGRVMALPLSLGARSTGRPIQQAVLRRRMARPCSAAARSGRSPGMRPVAGKSRTLPTDCRVLHSVRGGSTPRWRPTMDAV
jgi:hypothetical protein